MSTAAVSSYPTEHGASAQRPYGKSKHWPSNGTAQLAEGPIGMEFDHAWSLCGTLVVTQASRDRLSASGREILHRKMQSSLAATVIATMILALGELQAEMDSVYTGQSRPCLF